MRNRANGEMHLINEMVLSVGSWVKSNSFLKFRAANVKQLWCGARGMEGAAESDSGNE